MDTQSTEAALAVLPQARRNTKQPDLTPIHIRETLDFLYDDGEVFEVCLLGVPIPKHKLWNNVFAGKQLIVGYYDDKKKAVKDILQAEREVKPTGIYCTINPCKKSLLGRANNRLKVCKSRTTDRDIAKIKHIPVDIDPERPTGVSSSSDELKASRDIAKKVYLELKQKRFPNPLCAESGNGHHFIYKNDGCTPEQIKGFLAGLSAKFSTDTIKIDTKVYNPARLFKIYGTTARKGENIPERPHRLSKITSLPATSKPVTPVLLATFIQQEPKKQTTIQNQSGENHPIVDVRSYLEKYGVEIADEKPHGSSTLFLLENCVFDASHSGKEAAIGQCADGKLYYQCFHNSCQDRKWKEARQIISGNDRLSEISRISNISSTPEPLRREPPPPESFPLDYLGKVLSPAAKAISETVQVPYAISGNSILAASSAAVQAHANIIIDGREMPCSEYFFTIAASGDRKSATDNIALYPHRKHEDNLVAIYQQEMEQYRNDFEAWREARKDAVSSKNKGFNNKKIELERIGSEPEKPLAPIISSEDPTYEGLYKMFQAGQPSQAIASDEGGRLIGGHAMNQDNLLKTAAGFSSFWDGKTVGRVRGGDGWDRLKGRRLSIHMMVQCGVAEKVFSNETLKDQGLLSRILTAWPVSIAGSRVYEELNASTDPAIKFYTARILQILETPAPMEEGQRQQLKPRALPLGKTAKELWVKFYNAIEEKTAPGGDLVLIRGFANKAAEHAARLAAIITLTDDIQATEITKEYMICGIRLIDYYLSEALRLYVMGVTDPAIIEAEKLLNWIKEKGHPSVCLQMIYQYGPPDIRDAKKARCVAQILEKHKWLIPVEGGMEFNGKLRKEAWEVNNDF